MFSNVLFFNTNVGPCSSSQAVELAIKELRKTYPQAKVISSSLKQKPNEENTWDVEILFGLEIKQ